MPRKRPESGNMSMSMADALPHGRKNSRMSSSSCERPV
jgi:hypothetical protein